MKRRYNIRFLAVFLTGAVLFAPHAFAADLVVSPSSGSFAVGDELTATIQIANDGTAINAIGGELVFPNDILSIKSISKAGSIIKLWPDEPSYSNESGTLDFQGIIMNPGFSGMKGTVLSVDFVAKKSGSANVAFSSGSILANDGNGTDILGSLVPAHLSVGNSTLSSPVSTTAADTPLAPQAPIITSSTNPDPNKWYSSSSSSFSWQLPSDVTAVRLLIDDLPTSVPTHLYSPAISHKDVPSTDDGKHYFHAQFKNKYGWGAVAHFRFQIDTKPPQVFTIKFPHGDSTDDPQPVLLFNTTDSGSGIDHYEVRVGEGNLLALAPSALSNPYVMPPQPPGSHTVVVRAIDKAGNDTTESADFSIEAIQPPKITDFPKNIEVGNILKIHGSTYPDSRVDLYLADSHGNKSIEYTVSLVTGDFSLVWSKELDPGIYELTAQVTDNKGAKSAMTDPVTIVVSEKVFMQIGSLVVTYFMLAVIIIVLGSFLIWLIWYLKRRFTLLRRRYIENIEISEQLMHDHFDSLRDDLKRHLKTLVEAKTKRELTREEEIILDRGQKRLKLIEQDIKKQLESLKSK